MKAFKFGLQRLLELREQQETVCRQSLAAAERAHAEAMEGQRLLDVRMAEGREQLRSRQTGSLAVHEVMACMHYLDALQSQRVLQEQIIEQAWKQVEQSRARLVEAASARKAVEKLRTRSHEAWREAALKSETSFLDEMSSLRYNRTIVR